MSPQASSTLPVGSAGADSWDEVIETRAGGPINELIDGLDAIAALAIPYARLPRRAYNVFSAEFASGSDIAGQTVSALLSRPKAGEGTVRALLTAAADAVAAHRAAATSSRVGAPPLCGGLSLSLTSATARCCRHVCGHRAPNRSAPSPIGSASTSPGYSAI